MSPSLVAPSLDELSKDLNYASMELDVANLFDLDMSLFDFGHNLDLDILSDPKGKSKCPRGRQLQYERNYRSNQKRQRERRLREWINAEQKLRRLTAVRNGVTALPEGGDPTLAQRVCQLVFQEQAILRDMYEMQALYQLSKGLDMLDWKRGVLIPGCKNDDIKELTEIQTTFVFHWEHDS